VTFIEFDKSSFNLVLPPWSQCCLGEYDRKFLFPKQICDRGTSFKTS